MMRMIMGDGKSRFSIIFGQSFTKSSSVLLLLRQLHTNTRSRIKVIQWILDLSFKIKNKCAHVRIKLGWNEKI